MPPLYLYIIIPFTGIKSKIAQWQNQSAKLPTTKHITHLTMQKTHMHGAKESHNLIHGMKPPVLTVRSERASQSKTHSRWIKSTSKCTRCSETSQPLWNEVSIAVQPKWLLDPSWPPHFNKALVTTLTRSTEGRTWRHRVQWKYLRLPCSSCRPEKAF